MGGRTRGRGSFRHATINDDGDDVVTHRSHSTTKKKVRNSKAAGCWDADINEGKATDIEIESNNDGAKSGEPHSHASCSSNWGFAREVYSPRAAQPASESRCMRVHFTSPFSDLGANS